MRIVLMIKNYVHNTGQWWLEFLPRLTIYLVCAYFFERKVSVLLGQYFEYDTTSTIEFTTPETIDFPAFTVCGCCLSRSTRVTNDTSYLADEKELIVGHRALDVLANHSVPIDEVVLKCYFVLDSRLPNYRKPCHEVQKVLESIHQGRKCFTFFTTVPASTDAAPGRDVIQRYNSYVYIEVNFTTLYFPNRIEDMFQDADISLSVHRANILPTQLNAEFTRIEPCLVYEFNFRVQQTMLKEKPYATDCQKYSKHVRKFALDPMSSFHLTIILRPGPRSQDECLNMCILRETHKTGQDECINYNNMITEGMLVDMGAPFDGMHICDKHDYVAYLGYIHARRYCQRQCKRDCLEQSFRITISQADALVCNFSETGEIINWAKSVIMLWPDKVMLENVTHRESMNVYELIGYLGGHAHLWLGLSAIQLYEVFLLVIYRFRFWYNQIKMMKNNKTRDR